MMRRIPPLGPNQGLRGGDRGGSHDRPLYTNAEVLQDTVSTGDTGWKREEYTDENGQRRVRMTRG